MNNINKQTPSRKTGLGRRIGFGIVSAALLALSSITPTSVEGAGAYTNAVLADNPVAYYRMNESSGTLAVDSIAGQNGTYFGGVTLGIQGPRPSAFEGFEANNTAIHPDGSTGYMDTGSAI